MSLLTTLQARELQIINWSLVGLNCGMAVFNGSRYIDGDWWGYGVAALIHLGASMFALWQIWRMTRRELARRETCA